MILNRTTVPLRVVSHTISNVGDSTTVWEPLGLDLDSIGDLTCNVTVSGIGGTGVPLLQSYTVTLFHPDVLAESILIISPFAASLARQADDFPSIAQADAYELCIRSSGVASWSEGVESGVGVADGTSDSDDLRQSAVKRSGPLAFPLAIPSFDEHVRSFEIDCDIVPATTACEPLVPGNTHILRLRTHVGTRFLGYVDLESLTAEKIDPTPDPPTTPEPNSTPLPDPEPDSELKEEPGFSEDKVNPAAPSSLAGPWLPKNLKP